MSASSSAAASPLNPDFAFVNVVTDGNWPDSWGKAPKTRKRITKFQLGLLEELFRQCSHPSREERQTLAAKTGMELRSVTIWLQNKRQLVKKNAKLGLETSTSTSSSSAPSPEPTLSDDEPPRKHKRPSLDRVASMSEIPSPVRPIIKRTNSTNTQVTGPLWAHMPSSPPSSPPNAPAGRTRASKVHPQVHKIAGRPYPELKRTMSVDSAATCVSTSSGSTTSSKSTSLRRRATERAKLIKPSMTLEWACAQAATREDDPARAPSPTPTLLDDVPPSSAEMQAALALCGLIHASA